MHHAKHATDATTEVLDAPETASMPITDEPPLEYGGEAHVAYWDASSLEKPQSPIGGARIVIIALVVIAAVIGGVFLSRFIDTVYHAAEREQATVESNITRDVTLDLPVVASYMGYDDATVAANFADLGFITYTLSSSETTPGDDLDIFKFPSDMTVEEGALLYAQGVSNLSASDASRILTGSWRFTAERGDQTSMRVRYVDFASGNLENAVGAAVASQGYDEASVTESGTDESGNLYRTGTVALADGSVATWRVSAIELEHVYNISGLPSTAVYVGIRVTI